MDGVPRPGSSGDRAGLALLALLTVAVGAWSAAPDPRRLATLGLVAAALGLLHRACRQATDANLAVVAVATSLFGSVLLDRVVLAPTVTDAGVFVATSALVLAVVAARSRMTRALAVSGLVILNLVPGSLVGEIHTPIHPLGVLESLWSPLGGLAYRSPVSWLGALGVGLHARRGGVGSTLGAAAALVVLGVSVLPRGVPLGRDPAMVGVLVALTPGIAILLSTIRALGRRHPMRLLWIGTAALSVWNLLFMEQYRREMIPRDNTVAFPRIASNNAALVARALGSPIGWPANWLFAEESAVPVAAYDRLAFRRLFAPEDERRRTVIDVGDVTTEGGYLVDGWSVRHGCGDAVCREVEGRGRLLVTLEEPEPVGLHLRLEGEGALTVTLNGRTAGAAHSGGTLSEDRITIDAPGWRRGANEIALVPPLGSRILVDWIAFEAVRR